MKHIHIHTMPNNRRWVYFAVGRWRPFRFLQHGGWIFFNWRWLWSYVANAIRLDCGEFEWPPRLKVTPEGAAALFLMAHKTPSKKAQEDLAQLFKEYWKSGYEAGKKERP